MNKSFGNDDPRLERYVYDRYLPEELGDRVYYEPKERGSEREIKARLDRWRAERAAREGQEGHPP